MRKREKVICAGLVCAGTGYILIGGAKRDILTMYAGIVCAGAGFHITGSRDNPESHTNAGKNPAGEIPWKALEISVWHTLPHLTIRAWPKLRVS